MRSIKCERVRLFRDFKTQNFAPGAQQHQCTDLTSVEESNSEISLGKKEDQENGITSIVTIFEKQNVPANQQHQSHHMN